MQKREVSKFFCHLLLLITIVCSGHNVLAQEVPVGVEKMESPQKHPEADIPFALEVIAKAQKNSAPERDPKILYNIGRQYYLGERKKKDYRKARVYFEASLKGFLKLGRYRALDPRNKEALGKNYLILGLMAVSGNGFEKNGLQALDYFEKSAAQGNAQAALNAAVIYDNGQIVPQNYIEAERYYVQAAEAGYASARLALGKIYQNGWGVRQNYEKAKSYYEAAALEKLPEAQLALGKFYEYGLGTSKNPIRARYYYERAAEQNLAPATFALGSLYEKGQGVIKNLDKAHSYYQLAAEQGSAEAQFLLFQKISHKSRLKNVLRGEIGKTEQEEPQNPEDLLKIGLKYHHGNGVRQNYALAKHYFELAADKGDAWAALNLGVMYEKGQGITQDYEKARQYYEQAAVQDLPEAQRNLGYLYQNGLGMSRNYLMAWQYYEMAAREEDVEAEFNLGLMSLKGQSGGIDLQTAKMWFEKSCRHDYQPGCKAAKQCVVFSE